MRTDRWTDTAKIRVMVTFRNFEKAAKNGMESVREISSDYQNHETKKGGGVGIQIGPIQ